MTQPKSNFCGVNVEFVCVWCGHNLHNDPEKWTCNAPDGDGHLYERKPCKVKEEK